MMQDGQRSGGVDAVVRRRKSPRRCDWRADESCGKSIIASTTRQCDRGPRAEARGTFDLSKTAWPHSEVDTHLARRQRRTPLPPNPTQAHPTLPGKNLEPCRRSCGNFRGRWPPPTERHPCIRWRHSSTPRLYFYGLFMLPRMPLMVAFTSVGERLRVTLVLKG